MTTTVLEPLSSWRQLDKAIDHFEQTRTAYAPGVAQTCAAELKSPGLLTNDRICTLANILLESQSAVKQWDSVQAHAEELLAQLGPKQPGKEEMTISHPSGNSTYTISIARGARTIWDQKGLGKEVAKFDDEPLPSWVTLTKGKVKIDDRTLRQQPEPVFDRWMQHATITPMAAKVKVTIEPAKGTPATPSLQSIITPMLVPSYKVVASDWPSPDPKLWNSTPDPSVPF